MPPAVIDPTQMQRIFNYLGYGRRAHPASRPPLKIGILGASSVGKYAVLNPARLCNVDVVAVAARDADRAKSYAKLHKIARAHDSYEDLIQDPEVDAVYVGLPNALHGRWTIAALNAGKHVLCEKPFSANAAEARQMQELARKQGLVCREAFHYREHPLMHHMLELVQEARNSSSTSSTSSSSRDSSTGSDTDSGRAEHSSSTGSGADSTGETTIGSFKESNCSDASEAAAKWSIGPLHRLDVDLLIPQWVFGSKDIRWQGDLGGGAMMDAGSYCAHVMRTLSGSRPTVVSASAELAPGSDVVDASMTANLEWPSPAGAASKDAAQVAAARLVGTLRASLQYGGLLPVTEIRAQGSRGSLVCRGFVVPFFGHSVTVSRGPLNQGSDFDGPVLWFLRQLLEVLQLQLQRSRGDTSRPEPTSTLLRFYGKGHRTTYQHQMDRFSDDIARLQHGGHAAQSSQQSNMAQLEDVMTTMEMDKEDSIANMQLIDDIYTAAGLPLRMPMAS